ncbi:MAG: DUF177 domain-containing protein [Cyanobacteria bacterium RM1_2_2]|nr:DUF177 domain-containing protein [Cyanobacteria bacterium RM1_2_2]
MEAIYIPQLVRAPEQTERFPIADYLPNLETLTPVQGEVVVSHRGNYLEVKGRAEAIVTLTCDRCLQQYNHRVNVKTAELIWLQKVEDDPDADLLEREVAFEDLVETLDPEGYFQPAAWLYEQFCLAIPPRQLCDARCPGIQIESNQPTAVDRRWASLESLKKNL